MPSKMTAKQEQAPDHGIGGARWAGGVFEARGLMTQGELRDDHIELEVEGRHYSVNFPKDREHLEAQAHLAAELIAALYAEGCKNFEEAMFAEHTLWVDPDDLSDSTLQRLHVQLREAYPSERREEVRVRNLGRVYRLVQRFPTRVRQAWNACRDRETEAFMVDRLPGALRAENEPELAAAMETLLRDHPAASRVVVAERLWEHAMQQGPVDALRDPVD